MAESQNLSRAAAFLSEGGIFTQWLADQASGQQGLITQLTDRIVWDKVTDRTTVLVDAPFLGVCGAIHMPELFAAIGEDDPLGLRERLLVIMYERPRFVRSEQLREACQLIPEGTLHNWLAKLFWTLHCVHSPSHEQAHFHEDLGYRWLRYTFSDAAEVLFWDSFDTHVGEQEAAYGQNQQAAKRAGKGKTRHFRLALPLHNLLQGAEQVSAGDWSFRISEAAVQASVLLSKYMDFVFEKLDLPRLKARQDLPGGRMPSAGDTPQAWQQVTSVEALLPDAAAARQVLEAARAICGSQNQLVMKTFRFLALLGLGSTSVSINRGGSKVLYFTKQTTEAVAVRCFVESKRLLGEDVTYHTLPREQVLAARLTSQSDILLPDLTAEATVQTIAVFRAAVQLRLATLLPAAQ
ncbi:unnamed protein product [Symbiodinium sp. CCMP2592]|nr:unnamed protein product [Symbiodinium sp. CCMP2592]